MTHLSYGLYNSLCAAKSTSRVYWLGDFFVVPHSSSHGVCNGVLLFAVGAALQGTVQSSRSTRFVPQAADRCTCTLMC